MPSNLKWLTSAFAVVLIAFCIQAESQAQRLLFGGGQGFRIGGPRAGMHFGGGQGASIGTRYYGMRFGNGQGARIGGRYYGMQFGGGQGTQIGRFTSSPNVVAGTYYYGDVQGYSGQVIYYPTNQVWSQAPYCYQQGVQQPGVQQAPAQTASAQPVLQQQPGMIVSGSAPSTSNVTNSSLFDNQTQTNLETQTPTLAQPAAEAATIRETTAPDPEDEVYEEKFVDPELDAPAIQRDPNSILNDDPEEDFADQALETLDSLAPVQDDPGK